MNKQYHILNGDALKQQFPPSIPGEIIVARECLVDGNVTGDSLDQLFQNRAEYLSENYGETIQDYFNKVVPEFQKIQTINDEAEINLWFEDDLFCQVNFWFVSSLLLNMNFNKIYLVRPRFHSKYGFGKLSEKDLIALYENRIEVTEIENIARLWISYQSNNTLAMLDTAATLKPSYPFIQNAVQAHIERIPTRGNLGRPKESLIEIMQELTTEDFGTIFKEFNDRESIYGFGDLQVKRLIEELKRNQNIIKPKSKKK